jgi:hypothetical protein
LLIGVRMADHVQLFKDVAAAFVHGLHLVRQARVRVRVRVWVRGQG